MNQELKEIIIPFSGFYESQHDAEIDHHIEVECELIQDEYKLTNKQKQELFDLIYDKTNFKNLYTEYAKEYTEYFFSELSDYTKQPIKHNFKQVIFPKEYNFTTDRIICEIPFNIIKIIREKTNKNTLRDWIKNRHTSCSGFISSYSNQLNEWGELNTWDHNQLETLLYAYIETVTCTTDHTFETDCLDEMKCKYDFMALIYNNCSALEEYLKQFNK